MNGNTIEKVSELVPESSIYALAERFELGHRTKGPDSWSALANQEKLDDEDWIRDRIRHGIDHLQHYLAVLLWNAEDDGDDGAALMWLGSMMHEAWMRRKSHASKKDGRPEAGKVVKKGK